MEDAVRKIRLLMVGKQMSSEGMLRRRECEDDVWSEKAQPAAIFAGLGF